MASVFRALQLSVYAIKTYFLLFRSSGFTPLLHHSLSVYWDGAPLTAVAAATFLCMLLGQDLSWRAQTTSPRKKLNAIGGFLSYCVLIWGNAPRQPARRSASFEPIQSCQNNTVPAVSGLRSKFRISAFFVYSRILTVNLLHKYRVVSFASLIYIDTMPSSSNCLHSERRLLEPRHSTRLLRSGNRSRMPSYNSKVTVASNEIA